MFKRSLKLYDLLSLPWLQLKYFIAGAKNVKSKAHVHIHGEAGRAVESPCLRGVYAPVTLGGTFPPQAGSPVWGSL